MKKTQLVVILAIFNLTSFAQVTDTGSNVGIGIATPSSILELNKLSGHLSLKIKRGTQNVVNLGSGSSTTGEHGIIQLYHSGVEDIRLYTTGNSWINGGNVGIGTTQPLKKLDIRGSMVLESGTNPSIFTGTGTSELSRYLLLLNSPNKSSASGLKVGGVLISDSYAYANPGKNDLIVKGKVGIGTSSIDMNLTIAGSMNVGGTANGQVKTRHINGKDHLSSSYGNLYLNYHTTSPVIVGTGANNSDLFVYGSVGIGTNTTGNHELAVEGSIGAREIKVEANGWSDFVFDDEYKLRSLEETEQYISKNKHLPEIPSEAEVTENGINLGEMDSKLLQKIEELTLYLIEQNKRLDAQQKEIEKLKAEIKN